MKRIKIEDEEEETLIESATDDTKISIKIEDEKKDPSLTTVPARADRGSSTHRLPVPVRFSGGGTYRPTSRDGTITRKEQTTASADDKLKTEKGSPGLAASVVAAVPKAQPSPGMVRRPIMKKLKATGNQGHFPAAWPLSRPPPVPRDSRTVLDLRKQLEKARSQIEDLTKERDELKKQLSAAKKELRGKPRGEEEGMKKEDDGDEK